VFAERFVSSVVSTDRVCNVEARSGTGDERYEKGVRERSKAGSCACRGLLYLVIS
jgi:hypothetical protein